MDGDFSEDRESSYSGLESEEDSTDEVCSSQDSEEVQQESAHWVTNKFAIMIARVTKGRRAHTNTVYMISCVFHVRLTCSASVIISIALFVCEYELEHARCSLIPDPTLCKRRSGDYGPIPWLC